MPLKFLIVEDMVIELGHDVTDMAMRLQQALAKAGNEAFDMAILDVNLDGKLSFEVGDILTERGIPFFFSTGYGKEGIAERFHDRVVLRKPFTRDDLSAAIQKALPA